MAKGKERKRIFAANRIAKENRMKSPGAKSRYAKKERFLAANGGFGFEYSEPKPWK